MTDLIQILQITFAALGVYASVTWLTAWVFPGQSTSEADVDLADQPEES